MKSDLPAAHLAILVLLFFISLNLFILDLKIFYPESIFLSQTAEKLEVPINNTPASQFQNLNYCPAGCLDLINSASLSARTGNVSEYPPTSAPLPKSEKEYFIPMGTGQTSQNSWTDMISTETVINPGVYGTVKEAYFIVSLKNPTQNGQTEARIYNVTDNNVVYGSHLVMNGPLEQTISSQGFALPGASKQYRIQLKSTLSYPVSLENARLKIIAY